MNLRRKLERGRGGVRYVETVYGRGYRLAAQPSAAPGGGTR